jgi:hypothetical protein
MVHLIGIPALLVAGAVLYRMFFVKAKAAVAEEVTDVKDAVKKI